MKNNTGNCVKIPDVPYSAVHKLTTLEVAVYFHAICNSSSTYSPVTDYNIPSACMNLDIRRVELVTALRKLVDVGLLLWDSDANEIAFVKWADVNARPERLHENLMRKIKGVRSDTLRNFAFEQTKKGVSCKGKWVPRNIWAILSRFKLSLELKVIYFKFWISDLTNSAGVIVTDRGYVRGDFLTDDEGLSEKLISIEPLVKAGALLRVNDEVFIADWFRYQNFQSDRSLRNLREDIRLIKSNRIRRIVEEKARVLTSSIKDADKLQSEEEQGKKEQKDGVDPAQKGAEESGGARQRKESSGDSALRQSRSTSLDRGSLDRNEFGILYDPGNMKDVELLRIIMTYTEEQIREAVEYTKNQKKILCYPSKILEALKDRVVSDESDAVLRMFQSRIGNVYERGDEELLRLEKRDGALFNSVRSANGEVRSRRVQDPRRLWRDIEEGRLKELSPDAWHEG